MTKKEELDLSKKMLEAFRGEQKRRTEANGRSYTGCYCQGCVECMQFALGVAVKGIAK